MLISIVTPSYNQAKYIERTIKSVLDQGDDVEYIVVDGVSDDGTVDVLNEYEQQITKVIIEPDRGQADAVEKGFAQASGEILAFLNSDDVLLPGALDYVREVFAANPDLDVIYGHRVVIDDEDQVQRFWILPPHVSYLQKRWDFIPQETCFWRREAYDWVGGIDPSYQFALDYDLFVRMMNVCRIKRVNRFLAAFREHDEAKTSSVMDGIGLQEIERVRRRYGIRMTGGFLERVTAKLFFMSIVYPGAAYRLFRLGGRRDTKLRDFESK